MVVKAREAASNLMADKIISETGIIQSEATAVKTVKLVVPDDYNYMVVVELWREDVHINTREKPVLSPTKTIPKQRVEKKLKLEVSRFVREKPLPSPVPLQEKVYDTGAPEAPGFSIIAVIAVLLLLLKRRRNGFKRQD